MDKRIKIWDRVAKDYSLDVTDGDREIAKEITEIANNLRLPKNASTLETGCGSGHISGLLAKRGYETTLVDFSKIALEKSEEFYQSQKIKGYFVNDNLLSIKNVKQKYDLVWNSGVLEHFTDREILSVFKNLKKITKKYLVVIVPNPESVLYLLFRYKLMRNKSWSYGKEYLRTDYQEYAKRAGFELIHNYHIGWNFSSYFASFVFGSNEGVNYINELIKNKLLPERQAYLSVYIFKNEQYKDGKKYLKNKIQSSTEALTRKFDKLASGSIINNLRNLIS